MPSLLEQELEEQVKALTDLLQERAELEISKSASARHYSDRIKSIDVEIEKQIPIVRDREIERDVECRIEYHTQEPGKKREVRLDTGEVIFCGQMTDAECQDLFINAEQDDAIDVPAVKLLQAASEEETTEVKRPVETVNPIHVGKLDVEDLPEVRFEVGKEYEIGGKIFQCEHETEGKCFGCDIADTVCLDYSFECFGVVLKEVGCEAQKDEPDAAEMHTCEDCGKVPAAGFIWLPNKWLCKACNDKRNKSKLANLPPDDDLSGLKFRACHYKGVTNFKFILYGKASWGNPINLFGDYADPNTESEALDFYHHLKSKGCVEA